MANPLYPSLIPRYVDGNWFAGDQPVDEEAKLSDLETDHEARNREQQQQQDEIAEEIERAIDDDDDDEMRDEEDPDEEVEEEDDGYLAESPAE